MTARYVAYLMAPGKNSSTDLIFSSQSLGHQEKKVKEFMAKQADATLEESFVEHGDNRRSRHRWPELEKAVRYCLKNQCYLIIAEIRNLTSNDGYTRQILKLLPDQNTQFDAEIVCCDQPFITKHNFSALVAHAKEQKKLHGKLIKAGLTRTSAKSGNPHAQEVINRVNRPKIENAIIFALMLQPVIVDFQLKGYSQRRMVDELNELGFTAPEGGTWVLSQLQKVIERIKFNEAALALEAKFSDFEEQDLSEGDIADKLNKLGMVSPKGKTWSADVVEKVSERIKQIHDIMLFNELVNHLMPMLENYDVDSLSEGTLIQELEKLDADIPDQLLGS